MSSKSESYRLGLKLSPEEALIWVRFLWLNDKRKAFGCACVRAWLRTASVSHALLDGTHPLLAVVGRVLKTHFPDRKPFISHLNVTETEKTGVEGGELVLMTRRKRPNVSVGGRTASTPSALLLR